MTTNTFWSELPKPFLALAPMDGVSDAPFRVIQAKIGSPAYTVTEFTSVEGIRAGALRLLEDLRFDPSVEKIAIAQLFGADPAAFRGAAAVSAALGFDGIDINMGCPAKNVTEHGAGAALIRDPDRAERIIEETFAGMRIWAETGSLAQFDLPENVIAAVEERRSHLPAERQTPRVLPISLKTRIGFDRNQVEEWIPVLVKHPLSAITMHGRTLRQAYTGFADWDAIATGAKIIRNAGIIAIGNGDIASREDGLQKCATYGLDGALIGRSTFGNPWIFTGHEPTTEERISTAIEHATLHWNTFGERGYMRMRKHLLDYARGFDGATQVRTQLCRVNNLEETLAILKVPPAKK